MKNHLREPIEETCPVINSLLLDFELLKFNNNQILLANTENAIALKNQLIEVNLKLNDFKDIVEQLRIANKTLRQWGLREAKDVDMFSKIYLKPLFDKD